MGLKVTAYKVIKIPFLSLAGKIGPGQNVYTTSQKKFPHSSLSMSAWKLWEIFEFFTQELPPHS